MLKILILYLFVFGNLYSTLPSEQEVLSSGHPVAIVLYAGYCNYKSLQKKDPSNTQLLRLMGNSYLLESPWLQEKGFIALLKSSKDEDDLIKNIELNRNYLQAPKICQAYLKNNLLIAFRNLIKK